MPFSEGGLSLRLIPRKKGGYISSSFLQKQTIFLQKETVEDYKYPCPRRSIPIQWTAGSILRTTSSQHLEWNPVAWKRTTVFESSFAMVGSHSVTALKHERGGRNDLQAGLFLNPPKYLQASSIIWGLDMMYNGIAPAGNKAGSRKHGARRGL